MPQCFRIPSIKAGALATCVVLAVLAAGCSSRAQRAQNYYQQGMSYLKKQNYAKARIELRNAVQLNAKLLPAWRGLAEVFAHEHNWRALAASYHRIIELDPKDVGTRVNLTKLLLLGGASAEALKVVNAAAALAPRNTAILVAKAAVLLRLKDPEGASREAQRALAINAHDAGATAVLAGAKLMQGDSAGALQTLDRVKGDHQNDLGILFLKVDIFDRLGDLAHEEALLRKLITLYPKKSIFRTQLIKFYVAHNRSDDAEKELRAVVAANPADVNAELELVNLLAAVKGPAAARAELIARIKAGGHVFPYQIAVARLDIAQGNVKAASDFLQKLIAATHSPNDVLTAQIALAELELTQNNVAAAEPLVTKILNSDSRNIDGLRLRALIHLNRDQFDAAIADVRTALNDQPRSPKLLATLALAYERSGKIELADKAYFEATRASGFSPAFGLNYVAFLRRRGLTTQAENVLTDLASHNPKNIAVLTALAQVKLERQDWVGAHAVADAIHRLGDKGHIADQINAAAFGGQKKFDKSLAILQSTYDANPRGRPMTALVMGYLESHQTAAAESFLQGVLKADPHNAEALVLSGLVDLRQNESKRAAKNFAAAIRQQPKEIAGYNALAELYSREKNFDEALKVVHAGLQQRPSNFALRLTMAGLLEAKGDYDGAIAAYDSMLKEQPGSLIIANNLASLLADHRTDKASLERASSIAVMLRNSPVPQFKDTLGWVDYRQGNYAAALPLLQDAAKKLAKLPLVHYHLGMTYLATGQDAKATEQFRMARNLAPNDAALKSKIDTALKTHAVKRSG